MSFISAFGKRKVYLINHDPINHSKQLEDMGVSFSKFLALQTLNEFRDAVYNDFIAGELFSAETDAQKKLYPDEYYLELLVPAEAVSHSLPDGHVFIRPGFAPKILTLKTADHHAYKYDEMVGFHEESAKCQRLDAGCITTILIDGLYSAQLQLRIIMKLLPNKIIAE